MLYSSVKLLIFGIEVPYVTVSYTASHAEIVLMQNQFREKKLTDILQHEDLPVQILVIDPLHPTDNIKDYIVQFDGVIPRVVIRESDLSSALTMRLTAVPMLLHTLNNIKYNFVSSGSLFTGNLSTMSEQTKVNSARGDALNKAKVISPNTQAEAYNIFIYKKVGIDIRSAHRPNDIYEGMLYSLMLPSTTTGGALVKTSNTLYERLLSTEFQTNMFLSIESVRKLYGLINPASISDEDTAADSPPYVIMPTMKIGRAHV